MNNKAYDLLTAEQKAQLIIALEHASKRLNCPVDELDWSFGRGHPVKPISIWKKQRIEV